MASAACAQAVSWSQIDLGSPGATGTYSYAAGSPPTYAIGGAGNGITIFGDNLTFVYTTTTGNTEMEAKVVSQSSASSTALSGLMMRASLTSNSSEMACIAVTPSSGVNFYYRGTGSGGLQTVSGPAVAAPVYLRLERTGTSINGYSSSDGIAWTLVGTYTYTNPSPMPNLYYEGFTVSGASGTLNSAVFSYETYMTSVPQASANLMLWLRSDVGITYSGTAISAWADQSGNSNNASQSTGALQPVLTTGAINNAVLPAVAFNGSSQYLSMGSDFANLTGGASIFLVLDPTSSVATGDPCALGNASNSDAVFAQTIGSNASLSAWNSSTSSSVTTTSTPLTVGSYQLLEETLLPGASAGTATGTIFVNGTQAVQATNLQNLNNVSRTVNYVGSGIGLANYFQGGIAEVLVYNTALSPSQRAMVESYVLSKYGIGSQPTLDAPTFTPQSSIVIPRQVVTMSQDQNATVFYTTDGSTPSINSQWFNTTPTNIGRQIVYVPSSGSINASTETFKAFAKAPFFNDSSVASFTYQIDPTTSNVSRNGLVCWFRADNGATVSSGKVSSWSDVSGSGNTATQGTSGDQPTFVSNAANGLPALAFNGTSQFLQLPSGLANFSSGASAFLVTMPTGVTAGARFFDLGNGATSDNIYMDEPTSTGASLYTYNGSSGTSVTASSAITLNQFQLLEAVDNGTGTATIYTNGVQGAQSSTMNSLNNIVRASDFIGQGSASGNYFKGQIAELLIYNRALTSSEKALLEGYLLAKYSLLNVNTTPAPILSVAAGTLNAPTQVAISGPTAATIYVTTDGTTPSTSSPVYAGPINVAYTQTVKAICVLAGVQSSVTSAAYTLNSTQWPAPSPTDTTPLQIQLQLPNGSIPQDNNQH